MDSSKLNIVYLDVDSNVWLATDHDGGKIGTASAYSTAVKIAGYEDAGYELVKDGFPAGTIFTKDTQTFVVSLKHKTTTATPGNPGDPGQPIDPKNPDGPKWPNGTDKAALDETTTETIHYVDQDGNTLAPDHKDNVTFTRTALVDEVTGAVTYSAWVAKDGDTTFDAVLNPKIPGYTTPHAGIGAVGDITAGAADLEDTVVYTKVKDDTPGGNIPGGKTPTPGDNTPTPGDGTPTPGGNTPTPGDNTPTPGDGTPTPGDDTPTTGDDTPTPGDDTPTTGDDTPTPGDDTPTTGDDTPTPGDDTPTPSEETTPNTGTPTRTTLPKTDQPATPTPLKTTNTTTDNGTGNATTPAGSKQLPQTGDDSENWLSIAGLSLVAMMGLAGAEKKRRKED
jgi:LPXTG-motif cell wall-anchored protein